ncbi:unnamed protein product [Anisakis simplex]|uniref:Uncharacterized protein n=1 Tax=Anisakis simplex TaxID=6269 RepID=A0A0M3K9E9_ANISI|nr:unnamed protein product [Anisakis simplex]
MATMNANANANNNNRQNVHNHQQPTNLMNTSSTGNVPTISTQSRRRSVKITNESRLHQEQGRLILGQLPVNRKRSAPTDRLNTAQWSSVLALSDKTIHQDNRCVDSMFTAQNRTSVNHNYFLSVQTHITAKHRQQAVEWLLDVSEENSSLDFRHFSEKFSKNFNLSFLMPY